MATNGNISQLNNDVKKLLDSFPASENKFFNDYTFYKCGQLKYLANKNNNSVIIKEYFTGKPILYNNPAYVELFNEIFSNYFSKIGSAPDGMVIYDDIGNEKSYEKLSATLKKDKLFKDKQLRELVIIKGLYDGFYSPDFPRKSLLEVLQQVVNATEKENALIAKNVQEKVTHLMTGYPAPAFELFNKDSDLVKLSDFKGKYVYLNFCNSMSYTSISDLELLKKLYEKYADKLEIITISTDEDFNELLDLAKEKEYKWLFLHFERQKDLLKNYSVSVYPTYYLIGPEGELLLSPSSPPSENFEYKLFTIMRAKGDI